MIDINLVEIGIILTVLLVITLILVVSIKTRKDVLTILVSVMPVILIGIILFAGTVLIIEDTTYEGGVRVDGIIAVEESDKTDCIYTVSTKNNIYYINKVAEADENYLMLDCKVINKSVLGIKTYTIKDVLFYKIIDEGQALEIR